VEEKNRSGMVKKYGPLFLFFFLYTRLFGVEGDAGTYGAFLSYWGPTARALGMGCALTGLADDASAGYFNPAGLVQLNTHEFTFMHSLTFVGNGTSADVLLYARPATGASAIGFTLFHLYTPGIEYRDPVSPTPGYTFTDRKIAALFTCSTPLIGPIWMGVNIKMFQHQLFRWSGIGFGGDIGLFFFPAKMFSMGINLQNVVKPSITLLEETWALPSVLRSGLSIRPWKDKLAIALDMTWCEYRRPIFSVGFEYRASPMLYLRTGLTQAYAGIGLGVWKDQRIYEVRFDYALEIPHLAGSAFGFGHTFSISILFGGFRVKAYCPTFAFSPISTEEGKNITWLYFNVNTRTEVKRWEVLIKDEKGTVVKKLGAWSAPPYRMAWDGRDENEIRVPDGKYYYTLKVIESDGKVWEYEGYLSTVCTVGPEPVVIMKSRGEQPTYILERRKEEKKEVEEEKKRTRYKRRR
jgi:hypothetical protein